MVTHLVINTSIEWRVSICEFLKIATKQLLRTKSITQICCSNKIFCWFVCDRQNAVIWWFDKFLYIKRNKTKIHFIVKQLKIEEKEEEEERRLWTKKRVKSICTLGNLCWIINIHICFAMLKMIVKLMAKSIFHWKLFHLHHHCMAETTFSFMECFFISVLFSVCCVSVCSRLIAALELGITDVNRI